MSKIQKPEDLAIRIGRMIAAQERHLCSGTDILDTIADRDTAIREDEREKVRLELWEKLDGSVKVCLDRPEEWRGRRGDDKPTMFLETVVDLLQPRKPVHPRADQLAGDIVTMSFARNYNPVEFDARQAELAALLSSAVKPDGWKEQ